MNRFIGLLTLTVGLAVVCAGAAASDLAKEKRWADQIVDSLIDGEAEWLEAGGHKFLGIYTEAGDGEHARAAIVLHGSGVHPNWPQVVYPLRVGLTEHGWATLSLQMPVLSNDARPKDYAPLLDEVAPRLDAGIAFLRGKGARDIVIVSHSLGGAMAAYYLASGDRPVKAFVGVAMSLGLSQGRIDDADYLKKIHLPVLDLYGSKDLEAGVKGAAARAAAAAGNAAYQQTEVQGAGHFFDGKDKELVRIVSEWLNRTVPLR